MEKSFQVGDIVNVLRACRLPQFEEIIGTGTIHNITRNDIETLYWITGFSCARSRLVLRHSKCPRCGYYAYDGYECLDCGYPKR
jgi:hypothetical protein